MNVHITSRKFKAKDSLKDYILAETESLNKLNNDVMDVDVILSYENVKDSTKIAEFIVQVPGKVVTAKEMSDDFKKSINAALEKIEKQLTRLKTKRLDNKRIEKNHVENIHEEKIHED